MQKIFFTQAAFQLHVQSQNYMLKIIQLHMSKVINKDNRMTSMNLAQLFFELLLAHFNVCMDDSNANLPAAFRICFDGSHCSAPICNPCPNL